MCKEGYFGPDCGCTPRDDSTGHLTCDEDGTIMCLPGYQNTTTNCVEEEGATPQPTTNTGTISEPVINFSNIHTTTTAKSRIEPSSIYIVSQTTVFTVGATITSSIDSTMMTVTSTGKTTLRIQPSSTYGNTKPMSTTGASSNTGRKMKVTI